MRIDWRTLLVAALMTTPLRGNVISCEIRDGGMDRRTHPGKEDKPIGARASGNQRLPHSPEVVTVTRLCPAIRGYLAERVDLWTCCRSAPLMSVW